MKPKLSALHRRIETEQPNIRQIEALRHGQTVYRDCFSGFTQDDALHVMSVTKSVVALLVGIALDSGLIQSVRQPILDFFPDYAFKRGEKTIQQVTVEHLLTMTAPYKYRSEPWTKVCTSDDWTLAALDLVGGRAGLTNAFRYSTLGVHILTGILKRQSGMATVDFANRFLFEPLGIAPYRSFLAETAEQHKAFILSREPKKHIWFSDPQDVAAAGYGLCMSAADMAKLGQLCLSGGVWNGQRIVSAQWIAEMVKPRILCDALYGNMAYGYLWWTPHPDQPAYAALGNSGNAIYVDPAKDAVVAVTGTFKPNIYDRVDFIEAHILPLLGD